MPLEIDIKYRGEDYGITIKRNHPKFGSRVFYDPIKVHYFSDLELDGLVALIDDQAVLHSRFSRSSDYMFAVDLDGQLTVFPFDQTPRGVTLAHSSLSQGRNILMCGRLTIDVVTRKITEVSNKCNRYKPTEKHLNWFMRTFIPNYKQLGIEVLNKSS